MENSVLTIAEVAEYLKLSERTILRLVHRGAFPGTKVGNQWRFLRFVIDDWLLTNGNKHLIGGTRNDSPLLLSELIDPAYILLNVKPGKKEAILEQLVNPFVENKLIKSPNLMIQKLMNREQISSTGIGNGVAFPHIRNPRENPPKLPPIVVGICKEGIDYNAIDQIPVTLIFLLSAHRESMHLRILSRLGYFLQNESLRKSLMNVTSKEEFIQMIKANESSDEE